MYWSKSIICIAYIFIFTGMGIDLMKYHFGLPYNTIIITEEESNSTEDTHEDAKIYKVGCTNTLDFENFLSTDNNTCKNYKQDFCFWVVDVLHEKENPPEA